MMTAATTSLIDLRARNLSTAFVAAGNPVCAGLKTDGTGTTIETTTAIMTITEKEIRAVTVSEGKVGVNIASTAAVMVAPSEVTEPLLARHRVWVGAKA